MQCHVIVLDTKGTTYAFYERENTKETTTTNTTNSKLQEKGKIKKKLSCPPPAGNVAGT